MPTYLIDGVDLVQRLGVVDLAHDQVVGVGVEPTDPLLYPDPDVLHYVSCGTCIRQLVLSIHLGDVIVSFISVEVSAVGETIRWSNFQSLPGVRTQLLPCGPFVFSRVEYAATLARVCQDAADSIPESDVNLYDFNRLSATWIDRA